MQLSTKDRPLMKWLHSVLCWRCRMPSRLEANLAATLAKRRAVGSLRALTTFADDVDCVDFFSNDYLGFARSQELQELIAQRKDTLLRSKGNVNTTGAFGGVGSTGSRLISGNCSYTMQVEQRLADFYGSETTLLFSCGYMANLGVLSSLPRAQDVVLYDELIHNSCHEGVRLSRAFANGNAMRFRHNDIGHLRELLQQLTDDYPSADQVIFVVVESVYSMDGDMAPLVDMAQLCEQFGASVIVDEAHGVGVLGDKGQGLVHHLGLQNHPAVCCRVNTFGKAMGCHGAVACGSALLKEYLINYARSFIYTTAPPFEQVVAVDCVHEFCAKAHARRAKLNELIAFFRQRVQNSSCALLQHALLPSETAIQGVLFAGNEQVIKAAQFLRDHKIAIVAIRAPTVPAGKERFRIVLHAHNTIEEVERLVTLLEQIPVFKSSSEEEASPCRL